MINTARLPFLRLLWPYSSLGACGSMLLRINNMTINFLGESRMAKYLPLIRLRL
jgi:hypothetical protein